MEFSKEDKIKSFEEQLHESCPALEALQNGELDLTEALPPVPPPTPGGPKPQLAMPGELPGQQGGPKPPPELAQPPQAPPQQQQQQVSYGMDQIHKIEQLFKQVKDGLANVHGGVVSGDVGSRSAAGMLNAVEASLKAAADNLGLAQPEPAPAPEAPAGPPGGAVPAVPPSQAQQGVPDPTQMPIDMAKFRQSIGKDIQQGPPPGSY